MAYSVTLEVEYPERLSRWQIFLKWWLFPIPHWIALFFVGILASIAWFLAWWAILFTGRCPRPLFDIMVGYVRWYARVSAYTLLLRDEYPPFSFR